jgi:hypothetical protein
MSYFNSMGTPVFCKQIGNGLNGLHINAGGHPNETSDAEIAEFILYNTCLNDSDVSKIESYLATKWGLLAQMDPNVPGSTNTAAANVKGANASAPSSASNFPVTNVKVWADASAIPNAADGTAITNWASNTNDKEFNFNTSAGKPIVKMNVLNKMPVLHFDGGARMKLNKTPSLAENKTFTLAFVSRQTGGANGRVITNSDDGNTLYGYWGGQKNIFHTDGVGWVYGPGAPNSAPSNTDWDIYIITRNYRGFASMMRNNKVIFAGKPAGNEFRGLGINGQHETSDAQVAEIIMWDRCLNMNEIPIVSTYLIKKWNLQLFLDKNDPLYAEGVQIKQQRDQELAAADAAAAKLKAEKEAAAAAAEAARLKAIADAQAAAEAAAAKKQAEALAAAQKQIDDAKKALADAQARDKLAAEQAAAAAAAIQAKQQAALEAAKRQDEELRKQLANEQASMAQILAASKAYAAQQKQIQEENLALWTKKLAAAEETLVSNSNSCKTQLSSTISEGQIKLKSAIATAEANLEKALREAQITEENRINRVKAEGSQLLNIKLTAQEQEYQNMVDRIITQKNKMQEMNSQVLKNAIATAQENLDRTIAQNAAIANKQYATLQEDSSIKQTALSEQLVNLQNKYNKDIYTIAEEASKNYNALQTDHITKITNLQNQLSVASASLADSYSKFRRLQEETLLEDDRDAAEIEKNKALADAANISLRNAMAEYNSMKELDSAKYNAMQEASRMIANQAIAEYNALRQQGASSDPKQVLAATKDIAAKIAKSLGKKGKSKKGSKKSKKGSKSKSKKGSKSSSKKSSKKRR